VPEALVDSVDAATTAGPRTDATSAQRRDAPEEIRNTAAAKVSK
jgi:hypothetical protein